jgi:hypothetical protein
MDGILIFLACSKQLQKILKSTQKALQVGGLVIVPKKYKLLFLFNI